MFVLCLSLSDLTETQKQTLSALATLSSVLAGGILASEGWKKRFEAMGFREEFATAMAATLPLAMSGTKGAKGSTNATGGSNSIFCWDICFCCNNADFNQNFLLFP